MSTSSPEFQGALALPEIVDYVLGFLEDWNDQLSLKNCSLVCSSWATFTASRLFRTLKFDPKYIQLAPAEGDNPCPIYSWIANRSRVANSVRHVVLQHFTTIPAKYFADSIGLTQDRFLSVQIISEICAVFPHLSSMRIVGHTEFAPASDSVLSAYTFRPASPQCVNTLRIELDGNTFHRATMADVLVVFAEIQSLVLDLRYDFVIPDQIHLPAVPGNLGNRSRVRSLVLRDRTSRGIHALYGMITNSIDIPNLHTICVLDHWPGDPVLRVNGLLRDCAPHIREFMYAIDADMAPHFCAPEGLPGMYFTL